MPKCALSATLRLAYWAGAFDLFFFSKLHSGEHESDKEQLMILEFTAIDSSPGNCVAAATL